MTHFYLDIETIPAQNPDIVMHIRGNVKAPSNYKDPEKIAAYINEAVDGEVQKTSFDGAYGHIVCIGIAVQDEAPVTFSANTIEGEATILDCAFEYLAAARETSGFASGSTTFVGHNISGFDLPFIRKRSMILGIQPPAFIPFSGKPWDTNPYDTMYQWDAKNFCSLDKLLKAFGIGEKGDIDGSMVYQMWLDGKHDEIAAYCQDDVVKVRELYKRMTYSA